MSNRQISTLLSAILLALAHDDSSRAIDLITAGMTMLNGSEQERDAAWRDIEKMAGEKL